MFSVIVRLRQRFDPHLNELVAGASVALMLKLAAGAIAFGFQVAIARALGVTDMGVYVLSLTILTIATALSRFGLDNVLLRGTASGAAVQDWPAVRGLYRRAMQLAFATSSLIAILLWIIAPGLSQTAFHKPELVEPLRWMALAVVPTTALMLHSELLKGLKQVASAVSVQSLLVPLLGLVGLWIVPPGALDVITVVWIYTAATLVTAFLGFGLWRRHKQPESTPTNMPTWRDLIRSCTPLVGATFLGGVIIPWAPILFLGVWGTSSEVGIYGVANRVATLTSLILIAVNSIAAPKFAALYRQRDMQNLGNTARHAARLMTVVAAPVLLLFLTVPEWVLGLFGDGFAQGGMILAILAAGQFVNVATGSVGYLLTMSGHERQFWYSAALSAAVNVALCLVLIPEQGAIGAAVAAAVSVAVGNVLNVCLVRQHLGFLTMSLTPLPRFAASGQKQ